MYARVTLKYPNATKSAVVLHYRFAGKQANLALGLTVPTRHWQRATPNRPARCASQATGAVAINAAIARAFARLDALVADLYRQGIQPTVEEVSKAWRAAAVGRQQAQADVLERYGQWIEQQRHLTVATRTVHETARKHLRAFMGKRPLTFEAITVDFLRSFGAWLVDGNVLLATKYAPTRTVDSRWKIVKAFRAFLRSEEVVGAHTNGAYRLFTKGAMTGQDRIASDLPALTPDELAAVEALSGLTHGLLVARDLFLVQCLTGLRRSDLHRLADTALTTDDDGASAWRFGATKTGRPVFVPLTERLRAIMSRWEWALPVLSSAAFNRALKTIGEMAGLTRLVTIVRHVGHGDERTVVEPLFRLLTTHTGRRTFVSTALLQGVPIESVMTVTGLSRRQVDGYLRLSERSAAADIRRVIDG